MIATGLVVVSLLGQVSTLEPAQVFEIAQSPRTGAIELKLGSYKPLIDTQAGLTGRPYEETFGGAGMLLGELEIDRQLYQRYGSLAAALSIGYGEKFGASKLADGSASSERTALKVAPVKALAVYRFDYAAIRWNVPLVPYAKAGLVVMPWWITNGSAIEVVDGIPASGANWGYTGVAGLSFLLDFLEPRLARDFDSDLGVNHSYLFAEFVYQDVSSFGTSLVLSSRHWMFGLTLEY